MLAESMEAQINAKEHTLKSELSFLGNFQLDQTVISDPQGFRNKAKWIVTENNKLPVLGLTGKINLDEGRDLLNCPIVHPRILELSKILPSIISEFTLTPYNITKRSGELKAIIVFYSPYSQQMYLRFILRSTETILRIKKAIPKLQSQFPDLACISANIQPIPQAILEGPQEIFLTSQEFIQHTLPTATGEIDFKLSPQAFVQTNTKCSVELYQKVATWISEIKPARMLELFCGQGAFSFFAAPHVARSLGIEINVEAIKRAQETANELGLHHLLFKAADVATINQLVSEYAPDLVLVNPPRRGLAKDSELILKAQPKNFIYSSCSAESLALDLRAFAKEYFLKKIQVFDMFPHTKHFETLVWLEHF